MNDLDGKECPQSLAHIFWRGGNYFTENDADGVGVDHVSWDGISNFSIIMYISIM